MYSTEDEYAAFEETVKRTVYVDNRSPQVTEAVLKTVLDQFGNVEKLQFIPNFTQLRTTSPCALVEMQNPKQAEQIVEEMSNVPFMMAGMPRPVRACMAKKEVFDESPRKPGRRIICRWLDQNDPDFQIAEAAFKETCSQGFILAREEEKLANQQAETLRANYKRYEMIDAVLVDGTAKSLANYYDI